ncbi:transcription factor 25 isoform X2 [Maniola jurtina]|uniref:transcription factor 25 isoform X2 n=1 Tax=Maniola jurtina TaxID=191418 RepID=UPI001E68F1EC|nr:transcription factor 25 isoform X2 [Maniola jurtina]
MSRQLKKVLGPPQIGPEHSSSGEEEAHCSYASKKRISFAELEVQSPQLEYETFESTRSEDSASEAPRSAIKQTHKSKKSKKKSKKKSNKLKTSKSTSATADDIDEVVQQVNNMLGEPSPKEETVSDKKPKCNIFSIRKVHLNACNELDRRFPDDTQKNRRKPKEEPRDIVRNPITPLKSYQFKCMGLSMAVMSVQDGITYFAYTHNAEYQTRHKQMLSLLAQRKAVEVVPVYESTRNMHVEGMLELFRLYCQQEEYTTAITLLENLIGYLQFMAHPFFNLTNVNHRLEYSYVENRAFHIAILLYSYLQSNIACHRTALELAKMLTNLDPSDPLGMIFIIDTFAIRAREYKWLIEAIDYWEANRNAKYLFNLKYSYALAHFHILNNKKEDLKVADDLLKEALIMFPMGLMVILSKGTVPASRLEKIRSHEMFADYKSTIFPLRDVIKLYAAMVGSRWMEPPVLDWLLRNVDKLIHDYDSDYGVLETRVYIQSEWHKTLYRCWPVQVGRHLTVIFPLSDLVADGLLEPIDLMDFQAEYCNPLALEITEEEVRELMQP